MIDRPRDGVKDATKSGTLVGAQHKGFTERTMTAREILLLGKLDQYVDIAKHAYDRSAEQIIVRRRHGKHSPRSLL